MYLSVAVVRTVLVLASDTDASCYSQVRYANIVFDGKIAAIPAHRVHVSKLFLPSSSFQYNTGNYTTLYMGEVHISRRDIRLFLARQNLDENYSQSIYNKGSLLTLWTKGLK